MNWLDFILGGVAGVAVYIAYRVGFCDGRWASLDKWRKRHPEDFCEIHKEGECYLNE